MKDLLTTLKSLDPAREITMTEARRQQATRTLDRVLLTPRGPVTDDAGPSRAPSRRPTRRRSVLRAAVALPALVALGAAVVAVQGQSGGAYRSWTPVAAVVSTEDLSVAVTACRAGLGPALADGTVLVSERRGDFVSVFVQRDNLTGECRVKLPVGAATATVDAVAVGGASGESPAVAPRTVEVVTTTEGGPASSVAGAAGEQVRGLTVHSGDVTVRATVRNGRFVAWWPGRTRQPLRFDVTLDDGQVLTDVPH